MLPIKEAEEINKETEYYQSNFFMPIFIAIACFIASGFIIKIFPSIGALIGVAGILAANILMFKIHKRFGRILEKYNIVKMSPNFYGLMSILLLLLLNLVGFIVLCFITDRVVIWDRF